jgi:hypothetical protein
MAAAAPLSYHTGEAAAEKMLAARILSLTVESS